MTRAFQKQGWRVWTKILLLTALGAFIIETFLFLRGNIFGHKESISEVPWTFHTLWEIAALLLAVYLAYLFTEHIVPFLGYLFIGFVLGALCSLLWLVVPPSWNLFRPNYYGVQVRHTLDRHEEERGEFSSELVYDYPLWLMNLYPKEDSWCIEGSIEDWRRDGNEYAGAKGFLTWQAGLAYGFEPSSTFVPQFKTEGLANRLALVMTVGPVTLLELLIRGLYQYFLPLLIPQLMWYWMRRQVLCDDRASNDF